VQIGIGQVVDFTSYPKTDEGFKSCQAVCEAMPVPYTQVNYCRRSCGEATGFYERQAAFCAANPDAFQCITVTTGPTWPVPTFPTWVIAAMVVIGLLLLVRRG
jgi:hypothetical protein